jgi:16S rRNA (guanine966-N2)-methyltransferase
VSRSGVRIVAGELRGRRLAVAAGVRPTEARVREALFSIWSPRIAGCRVLDLFAGTGAVGLEALSRGAAWATFVELAPRVCAALEASCRALAAGRAQVLRASLPEALRRPPAVGFDLVFADPPYGFEAGRELIEAARSWVAPAGELVFEHSRRDPPPAPLAGWELVDRRGYGESCLAFYRPAANEDGS